MTPSAGLVAGVGGARRNAAVALAREGRVLAACEEERISRVRAIGARNGGFPAAALETALRLAGAARGELTRLAVAEAGIECPTDGPPVERFDHHLARAATAFLASPFERATVLVCDRRGTPEVSLWDGAGTHLSRREVLWEGPGFASLFGRLAAALGFAAEGDEHRLEGSGQRGSGGGDGAGGGHGPEGRAVRRAGDAVSRSWLRRRCDQGCARQLQAHLRARRRGHARRPGRRGTRRRPTGRLVPGPDGVGIGRLRAVVPAGAARLRVQTVGPEPRLFRKLLKAFGAATGVPVLVNTSFNGFHEPIVCTPRDAVRVFYGTGLDVLVAGGFMLVK
jgi:predicted NodU family carbamoyl transferase